MNSIADALRFTAGSVGIKSTIEELAHCRIRNGAIMTSNTELVACCPVASDLDASPDFVALQAAVARLGNDDQVSMSVTPAARLAVRGSGFKAFIPCVPEFQWFDSMAPEGNEYPVDGDALLKALRTVRPFIGTDATRKWSLGVNLRDRSAMVTNNIILVEHYTAAEFPLAVVLPSRAVDELLRIGDPPQMIQSDMRSMTFHYGDGRWLRTSLIAEAWPDKIRHLFAELDNCTDVPAGLFKALGDLKPFADPVHVDVWMEGGRVATSLQDGEGASIEVPGLDPAIKCHAGLNMLLLLNGVADVMELGRWPNPIPFTNTERTLRGMFAGMAD